MDAKLTKWLVVGLFGGTMASVFAEEITLTTYYPSPRGVYQELRATEQMAIGQNAPPQARLHIVQPNAQDAFRVDVAGLPNALLVDAAGNIGIGIPAPTEKLQAAGIIHSTAGGVKFPDDTVQTSAGISAIQIVCACGIGSSPCPLGYSESGQFPLNVQGAICNAYGDHPECAICTQP